MGFNCGIIGLPNVGKSTIFNALSGAGARMANYPFCTIEPNNGIVIVPDERLQKIAELLKKDNPIPTRIEFVDVAGLVEGASKGEGLGNKFLDYIRNVDALIHCVRCFKSDDVIHVTGNVDPVRDIDIITTEIFLADIDILERAKEKLEKLEKSGSKHAKVKTGIVNKFIEHLNNGKPLSSLEVNTDEKKIFNEFGLISSKPVLYLANTDEENFQNDAVNEVESFALKNGSEFMFIVAKLEEEISELPANEQQEYLEGLGAGESGLSRLIQASYRLLNLITYYTTATNLQAWTIENGTVAEEAAGKIHTDFKKGFIRAEVYNFFDLAKTGSEHAVKEMGKLCSEGKGYIVKDGDIVNFLFNV